MPAPSATTERMGKKKPHTDTGSSGKQKQPNRSPHKQYNLRLKPTIAQAFDDAVESIEPGTNATAVMEMLLRNWLTSLGRWPPKSPSDQAK